MAKGLAQDVFPAANGAEGRTYFRSGTPWGRLVVVRGASPYRLSQVMSILAERFSERGDFCERHWDAAHPRILVGILLPASQLAVLSAFHPAIEGEWSVGVGKEVVVQLDPPPPRIPSLHEHIHRIRAMRRHAFRQFQVARLYRQELYAYLLETDAVDTEGLYGCFKQLIAECLRLRPVRQDTPPRRRDLFASSISIDGVVHHLDSISAQSLRRFCLTGPPGAGQTVFMRHLMHQAKLHGLSFIAYHCALSPRQIDHLVFPDAGVSFLNLAPPHNLSPRRTDHIVNLGAFLRQDRLERVRLHLDRAETLYRSAVERGVSFLQAAERLVQELWPDALQNVPQEILLREAARVWCAVQEGRSPEGAARHRR